MLAWVIAPFYRIHFWDLPSFADPRTVIVRVLNINQDSEKYLRLCLILDIKVIVGSGRHSPNLPERHISLNGSDDPGPFECSIYCVVICQHNIEYYNHHLPVSLSVLILVVVYQIRYWPTDMSWVGFYQNVSTFFWLYSLGKMQILIAMDLASCGLDVHDVTHL